MLKSTTCGVYLRRFFTLKFIVPKPKTSASLVWSVSFCSLITEDSILFVALLWRILLNKLNDIDFLYISKLSCKKGEKKKSYLCEFQVISCCGENGGKVLGDYFPLLSRLLQHQVVPGGETTERLNVKLNVCMSKYPTGSRSNDWNEDRRSIRSDLSATYCCCAAFSCCMASS